mmetsp:Transcript_21411/g.54503  ORF Transcript_21411/g.54503 Transcript_21411/m.54503 type:complete len:275 (-) Transcript_21411:236-1060(-)
MGPGGVGSGPRRSPSPAPGAQSRSSTLARMTIGIGGASGGGSRSHTTRPTRRSILRFLHGRASPGAADASRSRREAFAAATARAFTAAAHTVEGASMVSNSSTADSEGRGTGQGSESAAASCSSCSSGTRPPRRSRAPPSGNSRKPATAQIRHGATPRAVPSCAGLEWLRSLDRAGATLICSSRRAHSSAGGLFFSHGRSSARGWKVPRLSAPASPSSDSQTTGSRAAAGLNGCWAHTPRRQCSVKAPPRSEASRSRTWTSSASSTAVSSPKTA